MSTDTTLVAALTALGDAARAAGVDPAVARSEGERLAATVAEPARAAYVDWSEQTGGGRTAQDFTDAASRGRRYRVAPTESMQQLALAGSAHAPAYAKALADVALAACTLGEENPRVIGNASTAAAAQLGERAAVRSTPDHLLGKVLEQLGQVQRKLTNLDLQDIDQGVPGAFDLTGDGGLDTPLASDSRGTSEARIETQAAEPADKPEPEPEEEPKTVDELLAELDGLVGLTDVKAEIHRQAAVLRVEGLRKDAGLTSPTITRHLIFTGNPGTGKTTVARLVAGIYRALGLLSKGQLVEVDRSELVAGYLGQTAMKTAEVVGTAKGGVLFIDEAYSLAGGHGDQYGREAVDTLVKEMEDNRDDLVVIVAGYPVPMAAFITQNPGLESRFRTTLEFVDYTDDELVAIFELMAEGAEYDVDDVVCDRLRELLRLVPRGPSFGNARFVRNMLEAAIGHHAWRLREVEQPTLEQLRTLEPDDFQVEPLEPPEGPLVEPDETPVDPFVEPVDTSGVSTSSTTGEDSDPAETPQEGR